ncbi:MAG: hypothetical protein ACI9RU_001153 [Litorivivens sp.]|jgi:hypothetical protein
MDAEADKGPMMTAPSLRKKGNIFSFHRRKQMTFRLCKGFNEELVHYPYHIQRNVSFTDQTAYKELK